MPLVLRAIRSHPPPGIPVGRAERIVWQSCGGPLDEVGQLVDVLDGGWSDLGRAHISTYPRGSACRNPGSPTWRNTPRKNIDLCRILSDQVRRIIELGSIDPASGALRCSRHVALDAGPQFVGVLRRFPGVELESRLSIPPALLEELLDVWALLPVRTPVTEDPRKAIGDRGELYSYRLERIRSQEKSKIRWVARDDDSLDTI